MLIVLGAILMMWAGFLMVVSGLWVDSLFNLGAITFSFGIVAGGKGRTEP